MPGERRPVIVPRAINTGLLSAIIKQSGMSLEEFLRGALILAKLKTYTVLVHEAEPDEGGFWAEVLELPGCFASGETVDGLEADARDAIETYLLALVARGEPIPEGRGSTEDESTRRWEIAVPTG